MKESNAVHIVVDDDSARESLKLLLEAHGMRVWTYPTGQSFLDQIDDHGEGCALLDALAQI